MTKLQQALLPRSGCFTVRYQSYSLTEGRARKNESGWEHLAIIHPRRTELRYT